MTMLMVSRAETQTIVQMALGQSHHSKLTWRRLSETGETGETVYFSNTGVCMTAVVIVAE